MKWHQSFLEIKGEQVLSNWEEYVEGLKARFGEKAYEDPMSDLISLKQTGTVEEFQEQFDTLFPQIGINEKQAVSFFLSGLRREIEISVRMFKPQTLYDAYALARLQESSIQEAQKLALTYVNVAKRVGCKLQAVEALKVDVADGSSLECVHMCQDFTWWLQETLGDILWNFKTLRMEFVVNGQKYVLRGSSQVSLKMVGSKGMVRLLKKEGQASSIHLCSLIVDAVEGRGTWQIEENKVENASKKVFKLLRDNELFAKQSKCFFGCDRIEYLGHYIFEGVSIDPKKILVVQQWPQPKTVKELRGFLGLTGYYRREASEAFESLKHAVTTTPVLVLPDFSNEFVVETDASNAGIGVVLLQQGHPIAFISKALSLRHQSLLVYEKELLALIYVVRKWSHYLTRRHFIVKTGHQSLKYLLEQRISTPLQQAWLAKLMGYDFSISYKKGKENVVVDALSRVSSNQLMQMAVFRILPGIYEEVRLSWEVDPVRREICNKLQQGSLKDSAYTWSEGQLRRKGRLVVGNNAALRRKLIHLVHDSAMGGHSGIQASIKRLVLLFYSKGLEKDVRQYIRQCDVCQRYKPKNTPTPGLLQPLPIPEAIWTQTYKICTFHCLTTSLLSSYYCTSLHGQCL
ncbi:hypothetical protein SLEP1_g36732 [Rubroshorea leprosula]|uniref:Uncharacterized protein n=1 Tax=Rubroshorea leprosula TaxID=152421 RepID=A0AAV5KSL1_9ROSI|nr:hypothetical protein SLEP1_g36732 [Rubroshorea leprosula]